MKDSAENYKAEHLGGMVRTLFKRRSGSLSCDVSETHPGRGGSNTSNYFMLQILVPPIHLSGTAMASQANGYKLVRQADGFLSFVPFHETGVLPSVNAALWTVRSPCPCRQGEYPRPVRRVGCWLTEPPERTPSISLYSCF